MEQDLTAITGVAALMQLLFVGWILWFAGLWRVFEKAGRPGWAAVVPFWNGWVMFQVAGKPGWWLFLALIPILNLFVAYEVSAAMSKRFGKGTGFAWGLFLLPFVFYPILGEGPARYRTDEGVVVEAKKGPRGVVFASMLVYYTFGALIAIIGGVYGFLKGPTTDWSGRELVAVALAAVSIVGLAALWLWRRWGAYVVLVAAVVPIIYGLVPQEIAPQQVGEQLIRFHVGYSALVARALSGTLLLAAFVWSLRRVWGELH